MGAPSNVSESLSQGLIALLYLILAAAEGSPRILRVLDSRRRVIIQRTAAYFAHVKYDTVQANKANTNTTGSGGSAGGGGGAPPASGGSTLNLGSGQQQRRPRRYSSTTGSFARAQERGEMPPLLSDNRLLLGLCALFAGVGRAIYSLVVLIFSSSSRSSSEITGSDTLTDSLTMPLAWATYCLAIAVLFCHRDLMSKLKAARETNPSVTTMAGSGSRLYAGATPSSIAVNEDGADISSPRGRASSPYADLDETLINDDSMCAKCCSECGAFVSRYRSVLSMLVVLCLLIASLVLEEMNIVNKMGEYVSSALSFLLGILSIISFVEALYYLRGFGRMSQRVIAAIAVMSAYCIARGVVVLDPVQSKLCEKTDGQTSYYRCTFVFTAIDAIGLLLSSLILP